MLPYLLRFQFFALLVLYNVMGLMPDPGKLVGVTANDLVLHFAGYVVLFVSVRVAFGARACNPLLLALLFTYSVLIKVGQHFVPHRHFEVRDRAANLLGLLVGLGLVMVMQKLRGEGRYRRL